jgi:protein-tyrosine sulfotransferase
MKKPIKAQPPIFILSCHRSGSTLLRYIIDTHPSISSPAELNLGALCDSLYDAVYHTMGVCLPVPTERQRILIVVDEVRRIVSELMSGYASAKGRQMWCEKSPMNLNHLDMVEAVFPDAKYVCLYRNCMDVVHSILEFNRLQMFDELLYFVNRNSGNMVAAIVDYWIDLTGKELAHELKSGTNRFRIKYEELVMDPAGTLGPLFEYFGVQWNEGLLDSVFAAPHDPGKGDPKVSFSKKISRNSLGSGSTISRSYIPSELEKKMNELLDKLGYPTVGQDWDYLLSPYVTEELEKGEDEEVSDVRDIFTNFIGEQVRKHVDKLKGATSKIVVTGPGGGVWLVKQNGRVISGDGNAECIITVAAADLLELVHGRLNPAAAFDQGRLRVAGDNGTANTLGAILFGA